MISPSDIRWLAGLLEGEDHFRFSTRTPAIYLKMTDADVVEHANSLLGGRIAIIFRPPWKAAHQASIFGEKAAGWMMTLWSLMGIRRRLQMSSTLDRWRQSRKRGWPPKYGEANGAAKLTNVEAHMIRGRAASGISQVRLAKEFHVSRNTIWKLINGRTYSPGPPNR